MSPGLAELINCPPDKIYERLGQLEAARAALLKRLQGSEPEAQGEDEEYLTASEVAAMLKTTTKFVYNRKQSLGGVSMGHRTLRFPRSSVERYIARMERRSR
jgi:hypothetical protein